LKYFHDPIPNRTCGECTACCTALGVDEFTKPQWETCHHVCKTGCEIYQARPASCRGFQCLWLKGYFGNDDHRPDKLGLIFQMQKDRRLGAVLVAWESWPGAAAKTGRYVLERIAKLRHIYLFSFGETKFRTIFGPGIEELKRAAG
jgi:hypothetical protein